MRTWCFFCTFIHHYQMGEFNPINIKLPVYCEVNDPLKGGVLLTFYPSHPFISISPIIVHRHYATQRFQLVFSLRSSGIPYPPAWLVLMGSPALLGQVFLTPRLTQYISNMVRWEYQLYEAEVKARSRRSANDWRVASMDYDPLGCVS
ncbi:hypothetical protein BC936DRAFT_148481 [Jimgerdemannia flammicorona]|uniref:Uncharacterized protein n=1 Tax=Jimgerdemannia flammicorona TaxID=994334 RepID=A0A433D2Z1_9FUNG|nr:hypothetical protein BC936DRAFT_148481 [Jimgerdemannia flammicorona]